MYKRTNIKPSVKKSGSVESASDRSMSPNDVLAIKENKPTIIKNNRQQVIPKRNIASKSESVKTGITKPKPATKTSSKSAAAAKTTPVKQTKATSNANTKLLSPRVRPNSAISKSAQKASSNLNSSRSPCTPADTKTVNPSWKVPSVSPTIGRPSTIKPLPGRGGPKKQRKLYNPPTLFSLCKTAVSDIVAPPEVDEDAKDFLKRRLFSQALFGTVWDVLTKETKSNRITKEALITERDELSSELKELKENVDNKISTLSKQHSDTVANITATLLSSHQTETKQLKEGYESTIADLRSQLSVIEDKHTNHVHNIRDRHTQEIATLHREHEDQRNQLILSHQQEIARMEGTQRALEEQNEYLDSQIKEKDEIMQEEIQSQVQEQVQRYSTINAELQSLRDVIDMRNAEIKKLNTKIKDLEIKAEDARALEKDLRSYKDHNEQLRATIEMKAESERTLNLTQESLYQSIKEKESDNKNMVLKCEELQFRLSLLEEKQGGHNGSNIFAPANYSTPACSPRRQMSEPPLPADYVSSPRPSNRFSDSTDRLDQKIRPTLDQNISPILDQKNTRPHRHRHTSLDSGTYRVRGKPSTVPALDQLQLFGKASRPSRESHVSEGESHVSGGKIHVSKENKHVTAKSPSETKKRRDISPVWIDRRRCCSANQTRRVEEYTGSGTSVSSPGSEGSKLTPSPHSRTLWFVPLSPTDKTKETQPSPGLSPEIPKPSMISKSESHLLSPESSVSGKPPSINRASLRLQRHKLKNNTFTYSKYLAQKDRSETDLITSRSSVSLNSWPDDTCRESSTALLISDDKDKAPKSLLVSNLKDKVPKSDNKTHGDAYIAESFGDTFITFDASAMEERSTKKDSTHPLKSSDSNSIAEENKTDRQKLLEKYRNKKTPTDVTKPLSPGAGKSGGGRKSPGDILSTRGRNKSPGSASSSTTDLFMKVSSSLSRRLSLNRKHKKGRVTPETSSQIDIERYLYGKESEVCRREIGLDYTDLNYTVNNYSEL